MIKLFRLLPLLLLCACTETLHITPTYTPKIVVSAFVCPDSVWEVRLLKSLPPVGDAAFQKALLLDASAYVQQAGGERIALAHVGEGRYRALAGQKPQPGKTYVLHARAKGLADIQATETIPQAPLLSDVELQWQEGHYVLSMMLRGLTSDQVYGFFGYTRAPYWPPGKQFTTWPMESAPEAAKVQRYPGHSAWEASGFPYPAVALKFDLHFPWTSDPEQEYGWAVARLSASFHAYHRSAEASFEDNMLGLPPQPYSNVEGGLGVFAAYHALSFRVVKEE